MRWIPLALSGLLVFCPAALKAQSTYTVVDLGTLGGTTSAGNALNGNGVVTGAAFLFGDEAQNAFITGLNGTPPLRNLGTLGGSQSFGEAINASGQVAGVAYTSGDGFLRAFLRPANGGALINLGTLGGTNSVAYGLNGEGRVAGYSVVSGSSGANHAFLSAANDAGLMDLQTLPGGTQSFAFAVNSSGQVTGYSGTSSGFNHAFLSEPNGGALRDLGTIGGRFSFGTAINDAGQVAGRSETSTVGQHAFRSGPNGGPLFDLGTLGGFSSFAQGINSSGAVVGYSYLSDNSTLHAFLFATTPGMLDLNNLLPPESGWILTDARAISDRGQITGTGYFGAQMHAFLLTPAPPELRITSVSETTNGHIMVKGFGAPFQSHDVEVTADLGEPFVRIATITAGSDGALQFEDVDAGGMSRRFYRFVYP